MGFVAGASYHLLRAFVWFHEDNRYFASGKDSKIRRVLHAALSPFEARRKDGRVGFSYSNVPGVVREPVHLSRLGSVKLAGRRKHWQDHRVFFCRPGGIQYISRVPARPAASSIGSESPPALYWVWRAGRLRVRGKGRAYRVSIFRDLDESSFRPSRGRRAITKGDRHVRRRRHVSFPTRPLPRIPASINFVSKPKTCSTAYRARRPGGGR